MYRTLRIGLSLAWASLGCTCATTKTPASPPFTLAFHWPSEAEGLVEKTFSPYWEGIAP